MASKVYFTDMRAGVQQNLPDKLEKLLKKAGIGELDCKNRFTAVKLHFGEPGNLGYVRHNYTARIVEILNAMGARTFLTDANTLYSGRRANAIDHLVSAAINGFNPITVQAPVIIADGLKGNEEVEIPVNSKWVKTARIGAAIAEADVIVSVSHFKGHGMTGFGGTLKNIGMGCASRAGKMNLHDEAGPSIVRKLCTACGMCIKRCAYKAIALDKEHIAVIDKDKCVGCGQCIAMCRFGAVAANHDSSADGMNRKIAEYTLAVLQGKPNFHISFIISVSPECDCWAHNDMAIVPDIGMAASFDPVALDQACADLVAAAPVIPGSAAHEHSHGESLEGKDKFRLVHPDIDWRVGLEHAEKIGLGSREYELIRM